MEELLLELVTAGLLAVIGWIDGRTMEIPYALSGALAICALADFFLFPEPARRYSNPEDHRAAGLCRPQNCRIKQKSPGGCRGSLSLSCICWLL